MWNVSFIVLLIHKRRGQNKLSTGQQRLKITRFDLWHHIANITKLSV